MQLLLALFAFVASVVAWSPNGSDPIMGLNVGSYFIPEVYMMQQYIDCYAPGVNDTWALQSMPNVSQIMTQHLDNYIREVDFADAQAKGVNFVRIPVAYWMFIPTEGDEPYWTDSVQKDFYLVQLVSWAQKYDMEVLIDIHALPGSQNSDQDSGHNLVLAGVNPEFYSSTNLIRGNATVDAVIEWIQGLNETLQSQIAMIELINEAQVDGAGWYDALSGYYVANQAKIAAAFPNMWTVISDAWLGVDSWGGFFSPDQKVIMDIHWWMNFDAPPNFDQLHYTYCNLTNGGSDANGWKNPIFIGEFAAVQNNVTFYDGLDEQQLLQFYQNYYSTQLWAAQGSSGQAPLYVGAFLWAMICTNCGSIWDPYYLIGDADTMEITEPNWCHQGDTTATVTSALTINPSPTHSYNSCGIYQTVADAVTATPTYSGHASASATTTSKSAASNLQRSSSQSMVFTLWAMAFGATLVQQSFSGWRRAVVA